jgi:hypothetical protein
MPDKAQLAQHRGETILALSTFACTRHPRVRAAAFYAIIQFFVFHGRDVPARMSEQLLEVVLSGLPAVNNPAPRVRRKGVCDSVARKSPCTFIWSSSRREPYYALPCPALPRLAQP